MSASQTIFTTQDRTFGDKLASLLGMSDLSQIWDFSTLHKAVLGLQEYDLAKEIARLDRQAHVNSIDNYGRSSLHWAAAKGDIVAVRALLSAGANPHLADFGNLTALQAAVLSGNEDCVDMILRAGADVSVRNTKGTYPVGLAVQTVDDDPSLIRLLHAAGASVTSPDSLGMSALQYAACNNHPRKAQALLDLGADANASDHDGNTPLFGSIIYNAHGVTDVLLGYDIDFSHINKHRWTMLHVLARFGTTNSLERLEPYVSRCDTSLKDDEDCTALDQLDKRAQKDADFESSFRHLIAVAHGRDDASSVDSFEGALEG